MYWRLDQRLQLDELRSPRLTLVLPRALVPNARQRSAGEAMAALVYGEQRWSHVIARVVLSLVLLAGLAWCFPGGAAVGARRVIRGPVALPWGLYYHLRFILCNVALLAPLLLRGLGLFRLERGGSLELAIVVGTTGLDLAALLTVALVAIDRRVVALGGRLREWPRDLLAAIALAQREGRAHLVRRLAALHLVLHCGARVDAEKARTGAWVVEPDSQGAPPPVLELVRQASGAGPRLPWLNRRRLIAEARQRAAVGGAKVARARAALREAADRAAAYRSSPARELDELARAIEEQLLYLLATAEGERLLRDCDGALRLPRLDLDVATLLGLPD
jgi:hypothetical protein